MSRYRSIHWLAPTTMALAFLSGFLLVMAHHLFYQNLEYTPVPINSYDIIGKTLSKQQFNTAVGTALAYLIQALLTVAISKAYTQVVWRATKIEKDKPTLAELDCLHSALASVFGFRQIKIWWKYPLLLLLAIVVWCVPIASIITPATLSVENALRDPPLSSMVRVPLLDFTSLDFVSGMELLTDFGNGNAAYYFDGPSQPIQNVATAVAALGQILSITPPAPNASWALNFWGPAVQCHAVEDIELSAVWTNIWNSYSSAWSGGPYVSIAWPPWYSWYDNGTDNSSVFYDGYSYNVNKNLPFLQTKNGTSVLSSSSLSSGLTSPSSVKPIALDGPASLYVAVIPGMLPVQSDEYPYFTYVGNTSNYAGCNFTIIHSLNATISDCTDNSTPFTPAELFKNATLLRCDLVNTSYTVDFDYINGIQNIQISTNTTGVSTLVNTTFVFESINIFDELQSADCSPLFFSSQNISSYSSNPTLNCTFDPSVARLLSYQGMWSAFSQFIEGSVQSGPNEINPSSSILDTVLAQTEEFASILNVSSGSSSSSEILIGTLQSQIHSINRSDYLGLANTLSLGTRGDLKSALEQMFVNFTISLLAEPYLQPNFSSPFAPPALTNVTFQSYHNIYIYSWQTLWISYGLAILFTAIAVSCGMAALIRSGASYSDNFSTIVRVSRTAEMSVDVMDNDGDGREPLSKYLAQAHLNMGE